MRGQLVVSRTTIPIRRAGKFCQYFRLWSVLTKTSYPPRSAAFSKYWYSLENGSSEVNDVLRADVHTTMLVSDFRSRRRIHRRVYRQSRYPEPDIWRVGDIVGRL